MTKELLENVKEEHKFWLNNGKELNNLKDLYKELRRMNNSTFNHHVNESKNDFYNWTKDVYKNQALSDDLLECTTKESILFCLRTHLKQASIAKSLAALPAGYGTKNPLMDLPKGYNSQRITPKKTASKITTTPNKNKLVTLINLDEIRINSEVKDLFREKKKITPRAVKTKDPIIEISKPNIKTNISKSITSKVKALDAKSMINRVKGVYL